MSTPTAYWSRARRAGQGARDPEVEQHGMLAAVPAGEKDVLRLEVAVEDPLGVRGRDRGDDGEDRVDEAGRREGPALQEHRRQVVALEEIEHHVGPAGLETEVHHADHVRVLQTRRGARLEDEALHEGRVARVGAVEELESDPLHEVDV
ncbi:MAG: hypothetical protein ABSE49_24240, partial [Polyangiaceae bacterium]